MDYLHWIQIGAPLLAIGGAWGGARATLNVTRGRVKELQAVLKEHLADDMAIQREMIDRSARMETKIDILLEKK